MLWYKENDDCRDVGWRERENNSEEQKDEFHFEDNESGPSHKMSSNGGVTARSKVPDNKSQTKPTITITENLNYLCVSPCELSRLQK